MPTSFESPTPTPYATQDSTCGKVYMTREAYNIQMNQLDALWRCARCGRRARWDDDNYEEALDTQEL